MPGRYFGLNKELMKELALPSVSSAIEHKYFPLPSSIRFGLRTCLRKWESDSLVIIITI